MLAAALADEPLDLLVLCSSTFGITGGIAAYKAIEVLRGLQRAGCEVRVTMTKHACEFVQPLTFRALSGSYVLVDDYAADNPDPIAHITFSQTVDLFIIAPATANTLAKLASGVADDFLSSTYLACTSPVLVAPAMNTVMWEHPATQRNMKRLREDGVHFVEPELVAEVRFTEWTDSGGIRQPSFLSLVENADPRQCTYDGPQGSESRAEPVESVNRGSR